MEVIIVNRLNLRMYFTQKIHCSQSKDYVLDNILTWKENLLPVSTSINIKVKKSINFSICLYRI